MRYTVPIVAMLTCIACGTTQGRDSSPDAAGPDAGPQDAGAGDAGSDFPLTVSGPVAGTSFVPKDALFGTPPETFNGIVIAAMDHVGLCEAASNGTGFRNSLTLALTLANSDMSRPGIGSFEAIDDPTQITTTPHFALVGFSSYDANCRMREQTLATSGTVTLGELTATRATGSFSVRFPGETTDTTGSFDVPYCQFPPTEPPQTYCAD